MLRIDKVREALELLGRSVSQEDIAGGFDGFVTEEIAAACGLQRTNASKELNRLVDGGEAVKIAGRPVRYFSGERLKALCGRPALPPSPLRSLEEALGGKVGGGEEGAPLQYEEDFSKMLSRRPSMKQAVNQGKAAMLYPPNGLHTLIVGASGVGKSFFAEAMYRYGQKKGLLKGDAKYVVFNCAEYAGNPQLLLSNLFGHAQGAFTGADREKKGLVDEADGGLLLLDEVHRLPAAGQEMLFTLIDKGYFRRMGESAEIVKVNLRLVCATTENIESHMLATFRRRIPMVIHIPSLAENSMKERYSLICRFFSVESRNIGLPLKVSWATLAALLCYHAPGNVGQLCSDIQLTCARAFLDRELQDRGKEALEIVDTLLPDTVQRDAEAVQASEGEIDGVLGFHRGSWAIFEETGNVVVSTTVVDTVALYDKIRQLHASYASHNFKQGDIVENINQYIEEYLGLSEAQEKKAVEMERERLTTLVGRPVYQAATGALEEAAQRLNRSFGRKVVAAFCLHVSVLMEQIHTRYVCAIDPGEIARKRQAHPEEFRAAQHMMDMLSRQLAVEIPPEEVVYFAAFLHDIDEEENLSGATGVLVLMHGNSTASSMAEVVNAVLNTGLCQALDLPLSENINRFSERLEEKLGQVDHGAGVLVLADMGSLSVLAEQAARQAGVNMRCIEMASTLTVLEATRKCLYRENDLDSLHRELMRTIPLAASAIMENSQPPLYGEGAGRDLIVVTCISGLGAARRLCEMIRENVPEVEERGMELQAHDREGSQLTAEDRSRTALVVGAVDLKIPGAPYIEVDDVIMGVGFQRMGNILRGAQSQDYGRRGDMPHSILGKMLSQYLAFLDPVKAQLALSESFDLLCRHLSLGAEAVRRTKIRYLLHCACLIERAILKQQLNHEGVEALRREKGELFQAVSEAAEVVENAFSIKIVDTELAYIAELVDTD